MLTPSRRIVTLQAPGSADVDVYGTDSVNSTRLPDPTICTAAAMLREVQLCDAMLTASWRVLCWPWSAGTTIAASCRVCPVLLTAA
jgi:hypothetical protein